MSYVTLLYIKYKLFKNEDQILFVCIYMDKINVAIYLFRNWAVTFIN